MRKNADYEEYYAKSVLEFCFPEKFSELRVADRPDLVGKSPDIGIEVTRLAGDMVKATGLWNRLNEGKCRNEEGTIGEIDKCGASVISCCDNTKHFGALVKKDASEYNEESAPADLVRNICNTFLSKCDRAKEYKKYSQNALFISVRGTVLRTWASAIGEAIHDVYRKQKFNKEFVFNVVYLLSGGESVLLEFNVETGRLICCREISAQEQHEISHRAMEQFRKDLRMISSTTR